MSSARSHLSSSRPYSRPSVLSDRSTSRWRRRHETRTAAARSNLPGSATECQWNTPGPNSGQAHVRVTATDSQNAAGSADSGRFSIRSGSGGSLPSGWSHQDIGNVGAAGNATLANGVFTVTGSGADIWGTADEFHYAWLPMTDAQENYFEITARVTAVRNVNQWTKVGLMVRGGTAANAPHASLFVTPTTTKGVAFQRRKTSGATSLSTAGPAITAPVWLKLIVSPLGVRAYYRLAMASNGSIFGRDPQKFHPPEIRTRFTAVSLTDPSRGNGIRSRTVRDSCQEKEYPYATPGIGALSIVVKAGCEAETTDV